MSRHPSVQHLVDLLEPNRNLPDHLLEISERFSRVRDDLLEAVKVDTLELAAGLRKLLEAKDCLVRAAMLAKKQVGEIAYDVMHDADSTPSSDK